VNALIIPDTLKLCKEEVSVRRIYNGGMGSF